MGQYFRIVNTTKKQYVDIDELGENNKFDFIGRGLNGLVLARLICKPGDDRLFGDPTQDEIYVGLWAGDIVIVAGDYDKEIMDKKYGEINLYDRVRVDPEYKNITDKIIVWLTKDNNTFQMLQERAANDNVLRTKIQELLKSQD